jgi:hypothetical protein
MNPYFSTFLWLKKM